MELEYQLKIQRDRVQQAYQQEKTQTDCNLMFPSDDQICKQLQTCRLRVVNNECKAVHPDANKETQINIQVNLCMMNIENHKAHSWIFSTCRKRLKHIGLADLTDSKSNTSHKLMLG